MEAPQLFVLADRTLEGVVARIGEDQWDSELPPEFATRATDRTVRVRQIVNYHAYDDVWVPDMLAGRTMDEVGADSWQGDLLGDDPVSAFSAIVDKACAAAEKVEDLDRVVHCSFGDFSTFDYFRQVTSFRGLRAHDIAKALGIELTMPAELVQGIWDQIEPDVEEWRGIGVFPAAVPVPEDAPLLDRLLGITGRQPDGVYS